jgi:energy-coupling factor transporter ATP-binding protein EcfA2
MPEHRLTAATTAARLLLGSPPRLGRTRLGVVDGPSGSGKSTFAQHWAGAVRSAGCPSVIVFSSDLLATWDDPFGWWTAFDDGVLQPLSLGRPGRIRLTDWTGGRPGPGEWRDMPVPDVLILEGVSGGRLALNGRASLLVWIEVADRRTRLERAVERDGEQSRVLLSAWQDNEDGFYAADRTVERADLVVDATVDGACCRP